MTPRERALLLLTSHLGDLSRRCLTQAQFRRVWSRSCNGTEGWLCSDPELAPRVRQLLAEEERLEGYLRMGRRRDCIPVCLESQAYPQIVEARMGINSPGVLWAKGRLELLQQTGIALVGSRELTAEGREFAREVGRQAAEHGFVLISGNARGADREAQQAALEHGGQVICIVADALTEQVPSPDILYLSEDSFDLRFSAQRALSRNRVIHSLGACTFVAQSDHGKGGTWDGTTANLKYGWSTVYCHADGSSAAREFENLGATAITTEDIGRTLP